MIPHDILADDNIREEFFMSETASIQRVINTTACAYTERDRQTFIRELDLTSLTNNLNNFDSFVSFMAANPRQTPAKLGIYIVKIMRF